MGNRALLVALVAVAAAVGPITPARAAVVRLPKITVHGDSLMYEARAFVIPDAKAHGYQTDVHGLIGAAACDYIKPLRAELAKLEPAIIVIEAAGNSRTLCMRDPDHRSRHLALGSQAWFDRYRADYNTIFAMSAQHGIPVLVIAPPSFDPNGSAPEFNLTRSTLWPQLQADALTYDDAITFVDGPREALGGDAFRPRLPCLPDETVDDGCGDDGQITVRAPDGVHFCPTGLDNTPGNDTGCALDYSSGAVRYGTAITDEIWSRLPSRA